jgi:hypothetical protein
MAAALALCRTADDSCLAELQTLAEHYPEVATHRMLIEACQSARARSKNDSR